MSKENYDSIKRIKDLEERDKRRTAIAEQFMDTVVPLRKAKEIKMAEPAKLEKPTKTNGYVSLI